MWRGANSGAIEQRGSAGFDECHTRQCFIFTARADVKSAVSQNIAGIAPAPPHRHTLIQRSGSPSGALGGRWVGVHILGWPRGRVLAGGWTCAARPVLSFSTRSLLVIRRTRAPTVVVVVTLLAAALVCWRRLAGYAAEDREQRAGRVPLRGSVAFSWARRRMRMSCFHFIFLMCRVIVAWWRRRRRRVMTKTVVFMFEVRTSTQNRFAK